MRLRVLALALAGICASSAWAVQPFVVKDIRVEGIQRTEAGTVFSYLPVKVNETMNDEKASAAIKALYATGFFSDVRLEVDKDILVVIVQERPAIAQIDIDGAKEFSRDNLKDGLKQVGLSEAKIYDKALLDRAEKEIKRQYLSRGYYSADVTTTVTPLERNRVALSFKIVEGEVAKIRDINIIGAQAFKEKSLRGLFQLTTPGLFTWISKNDQYSKQKLSADLETLRSFYLNRGYLEFNINSTQVQITPDKQDIYITLNISEGPVYTVTDVKLAGELLVPEAELRSLITIKPGDTFSRDRLTESSKKISDRLSNDGYSFANINAVPELDKEKHTAAFTFQVDPGRRVYVRRINISGNTRTQDEVVRRELRQMEGGWYSGEKIARSKQRLDRTNYFSEVNVETPPVPATTDQVDVNINVTERQTGSIQLGAGFSSADKLVLSASVSQSNIFGTGNFLSAQINNGQVNKVYALSFTNPYFTSDGVSFGYDLYKRDTDYSELSTGNYNTSTTGAGVRLGLPVTETDAINLGLALERTNLETNSSTPQRVQDFVTTNGEEYDTVRGSITWSRDTRDSIFYATKGRLQEVGSEFGLPGGDLKYYKLRYRQQWLYPATTWLTMSLNGELGYADGYGGKELPFFRNFYLGGVGSVRGYETSSLGPRDPVTDDSIGGNRSILFNAEALFPLPGLNQDKSVRLSAFIDGGQVFDKNEKISMDELRYSAGIAVSWYSPVGPLKFSIANPLNKKDGDKVERFQFQLGTFF
ncbi:MAG TPA: outer membrane protein assembly factor BamA [Burkholderiales bacterium]|nr:outer membrane protein assembly factor BamA [Burkholderiales bacterium]